MKNKKSRKKNLTSKQLAEVARLFAVFSDPTRLAILQCLMHKPYIVTELVADLALSQPAISKQLRYLLDAGMVSRTAEGNRAVYSIRAKIAEHLCQLACDWIVKDAKNRLSSYEQ